MALIGEKMEVMSVLISDLTSNEYSANREDSLTFERLKKELDKYGMVELPLVITDNNDRMRVLAGHHRIRAWEALGHQRVSVICVRGTLSPEEEFNLVNNLNRVRGDVHRGKAIAIVREKGLDHAKLDLFKMPTSLLFPRLDRSDLEEKETAAQRRAKIHALTLEVAQKIAQDMVDGCDDLLTLLIVKDKVGAVVRIPFTAGASARRKAADIKERIEQALGAV